MVSDPQAFVRGEPEAIREVVDATLTQVWGLARGGFITTDPQGVPVWVRGLDNPDEAEELTALCIAEGLSPARRAAGDGQASVWAAASERLWNHAVSHGRVVSLLAEEERAEVPTDVPELQDAAPAAPAQPVQSERTKTAIQAARQAAQVILADEGERSQQLVALLWEQGKSSAECAQVFGCGVHAVYARQSRLHRKIRLRLRRHPPHVSVGRATVDLALANDPDGLPSTLYERIAKEASSRIAPTEARPYSARLAWGVGISVIALGLWLAMVFGVLPRPGDDPRPQVSAQIICKGPCAGAKTAAIHVLAPPEANRVAVFRRRGDAVHPILVSPAGGAIGLPLGASDRQIPLPYPATLNAEWADGDALVTVFAADGLTAHDAAQFAGGKRIRDDVVVATTTVSGT